MKLRYITGRGGSATHGLSSYLSTLVDDYKGLANDSVLHRLSVDEQIRVVAEFSEAATHLIANSFGAYLWLLSRIDAAPSDTRVLLLSPVLGRAVDPEKMLLSRPPRLRALESAIAEGRVILPSNISVRTGREDPVCDFQVAIAQCERLGVRDLMVLAGEEHNIDHHVTAHIVDESLKPYSDNGIIST